MKEKICIFCIEHEEKKGYMIYSYNKKTFKPIFEELHLNYLSNLMDLHNLTTNLIYNDINKIYTYKPNMELIIKNDKKNEEYLVSHRKLNEIEKKYLQSYDIKSIELNDKQISKLEKKIKQNHLP